MAIDPALLEILRCPAHPDGPKLLLKGSLLICQVDGVGYKIVDGIPDMLLEDSIPADQVALEQVALEQVAVELSDSAEA
jgi:uncharacterized protein YbaR (Trm112 family)